MSLPTLVTITLSHYCERARWGLDRSKVAYREARHAPGFHALAVHRAGGQRSTPILVTAEGVVGDSSAILLWANERAAAGRELYPEDPAAYTTARALEEGFDKDFGPHVRRAVYFDLLPDRRLVLPMMTHGVPRMERTLMPLVFGPLRSLMRSSMHIDAAGAERSVDRVMTALQPVNDRLADGRRYLLGERFSAADITFASLIAPLVWVPGYGIPLPDLKALPARAAERIRAMRETPAGKFCLRMYREERH